MSRKASSRQRVSPGAKVDLYSLAVRHYQAGRLEEARATVEAYLQAEPGAFLGWNLKAVMAYAVGDLATTEQAYRRMLAIQPDHGPVHYNLGFILQTGKRWQEAVEAYMLALRHQPDDLKIYNNLGVVLHDLERFGEAEAIYRRALERQPDYADVHNNLGRVLKAQGKFAEAEAAFLQVIKLRPESAEVWFNLGNLLKDQQRWNDAEAAYRRAIALRTDYADAWQNMGVLMKDQSRFAESEAAYRRILEIRPDDAQALGHAAFCARYLCNWHQTSSDATRLLQLLERNSGGMSPFTLLSLEQVTPVQHRKASHAWALEHLQQVLDRSPMVDPTHHPVHDRLRVGYLSADFRDHAVMYHLGEVLTLHDRKVVEIHAYSYGPNTQDVLRVKAESACEYFHDVRTWSDDGVAQHMVDTGIDLLVDLTGYTTHGRLGIAARRPAPVVVSWLGYPGTLGHPRLADYLIGDPVGTPLEHAHHFSETLALMPHCAGPHDNSSVIGPAGTRCEHGLPSDGFVFCCFNQSYKFTPSVFLLWCRLLLEVPGSVLWLRQANPVAMENLRQFVLIHGVAPDRLVFAPPVSHEAHRGRLQLADLALDTFPYGFGATGFNALWSGVPFVTRMGETTVSRMGAAQLHAIGLPELVTTTPEEYFDLALALARDPQRLAGIRQRLAANRLTMPLFDTQQFTRDLEQLYQTIWEQHGRGVREAIVLPDRYLLAVQHYQAGRMDDARAAVEQYLRLEPESFLGWNLRAVIASITREVAAAEAAYRRALEIRPGYAEAWYNFGVFLGGQQRFAEAADAQRRAIELKPDYAAAWSNLATALKDQDQLVAAEQACRRALTLRPDDGAAWNQLGLLMKEQYQFAEAESAYRRALALRPDYIEAWHNLGLLMQVQHRVAEAEAAYRRVVGLRPDCTEAWSNLGVLLQARQRFDEAETAFQRALQSNPDYASAWNNLGIFLQARQRFDEAGAAYRRAVALRPDHVHALGMAAHCAQYLCQWQQARDDAQRLVALRAHETGAIPPFTLLSMVDFTPEQHRHASAAWARSQFRYLLDCPPVVAMTHHPVRDRLHIGYMSVDVHDHPVMFLLAGVLAAHDRSRFGIHVYSCGPTVRDRQRQRMERDCEYFHDVGTLSDDEVAQQMAADGIDILLDLTGYTASARTGIMARRPAPVLVSWLGYPGTLGHPRLADYLIGDPVMTPPEHASHFSETLAYLPHCSFPHDRAVTVGPLRTREEVGLPARGFVFCCFNQSYKLDAQTFTLWCQLLCGVPDSVLWLQQPTAPAMETLCRTAAAQGVDPARLVFAPLWPYADHLGRIALADLALDTFPYGSGATANNALWAGVPLVTRIGESFVSRMAASLLHAAGLPDLVTTTPEEYFTLALTLARDPQRLAGIRQRLAANRLTVPLFDTELFTRDLERLYQTMWEQHGQRVRQSQP